MDEILLYKTPNGNVRLEVFIRDETIWLTQKQIADLFGVKIPAISKHIKNIYESGELDEKVVVSKMEITTQHGAIEGKQQTKEVNFYNLDMIMSETEFEKYKEQESKVYVSDFDKMVEKLEKK